MFQAADNSILNESSDWLNTTLPGVTNGDSLDIVFFVYYLGVLTVLSLVGIVGNTMVIRALFLHRDLRSPNNYFVLSLAVSDLLLGVTYPLYDVLHLSDKYQGDVFGKLFRTDHKKNEHNTRFCECNPC